MQKTNPKEEKEDHVTGLYKRYREWKRNQNHSIFDLRIDDEKT